MPQPSPSPAPVPVPEPVEKSIPSLTVAMHWQYKNSSGRWQTDCSSDDVDMYVDAPGEDGRRMVYSYKKKKHAGSPALYLVDAMRGGGEVWMHPKVTPGVYRVSFCLFNVRSSYPGGRVLLTVVTPDGTYESEKASTEAWRPYEFSGSSYKSDSSKKYHMVDIEVKEGGGIVFHDVR